MIYFLWAYRKNWDTKMIYFHIKKISKIYEEKSKLEWMWLWWEEKEWRKREKKEKVKRIKSEREEKRKERESMKVMR